MFCLFSCFLGTFDEALRISATLFYRRDTQSVTERKEASGHTLYPAAYGGGGAPPVQLLLSLPFLPPQPNPGVHSAVGVPSCAPSL